MNAAEVLREENERPRLLAEVFENGISLGSYVTDGEDRLIIGSSKRADLVVPHAKVSHIHAMLRLTGKQILLYDLGSEQGTYVGGKKIIERSLSPGEFFEIGAHRVKVNILEEEKENTERSLFWKSRVGDASYLEMLRIENGVVSDERALARNGRIAVGRRKNEILLANAKSGENFVRRKDSGATHAVECLAPSGYIGEIYDSDNNLVSVIEQSGSMLTFNELEKLRLVSADQKREILLFWRSNGIRNSRWMRDPDSPVLQRALAACAIVAAIILTANHLMLAKPDVIEEAATPKSSYFRMSMDSSPAPAESESSAPAQPQQAAPSKAASISSTLSKLLNKKSNLTAETIQQAISTNGSQTVRSTNLKNANIKSEAIAAGSVGGGVNANAISAGLSNGSGTSAGSLKGFANGKGGAIGGTGSGFGGKGFDMSLGGDEAEAIGGLDKALIAAVVQANLGQIKHCYEKQLIVDPNIFGKVVAGWTINKDGIVSVTSVKKTTMNNKSVENCILGKIKNWQFPKPKGGGQVLVSYPFLFKSLN